MKKSVKKKEMSIDDLAVMVAKGFSSVDERFNEVDKRFNEVDNRFDKVEQRLNDVEDAVKATRQDVLKVGDKFVPRYEFDMLLSRVSRIEQKIEGKHK